MESASMIRLQKTRRLVTLFAIETQLYTHQIFCNTVSFIKVDMIDQAFLPFFALPFFAAFKKLWLFWNFLCVLSRAVEFFTIRVWATRKAAFRTHMNRMVPADIL